MSEVPLYLRKETGSYLRLIYFMYHSTLGLRVIKRETWAGRRSPRLAREREFFIDNLLVRIHLIIEMILVDRPRAMGV